MAIRYLFLSPADIPTFVEILRLFQALGVTHVTPNKFPWAQCHAGPTLQTKRGILEIPILQMKGAMELN